MIINSGANKNDMQLRNKSEIIWKIVIGFLGIFMLDSLFMYNILTKKVVTVNGINLL
jgi:hypothetical protein